MPKKRKLEEKDAESIKIYAPDAKGEEYALRTVRPGDLFTEGLTRDWIQFLKSMDLEMKTGDEREAAHQDNAFNVSRAKYNDDPDHNENPIEMLASVKTNPEVILFGTDNQPNNDEIVDVVHEIVECELPKNQVETMRDLYGLNMTLQEIATRDGVRKQGVSSRDKKLCRSVEKKLAARDITEANIDKYGFFQI